jgi:hypothetical protein
VGFRPSAEGISVQSSSYCLPWRLSLVGEIVGEIVVLACMVWVLYGYKEMQVFTEGSRPSMILFPKIVLYLLPLRVTSCQFQVRGDGNSAPTAKPDSQSFLGRHNDAVHRTRFANEIL